MLFDRDQFKPIHAALGALYAGAVTFAVYVSTITGLNWPATLGLIVLILATWPVALVINRGWEKRGAAKKSPDEQVPPAPASKRKPGRIFPELERDTAVAVKWLRDKLDGKATGDTLYSRPWFLVAGPPLSGKTALLLSAGLDFHLLDGQARAEQYVVRATDRCDWRITNDAVLLDTAGRYQTEGRPDREEWLGLIDLLKKQRPQRPLDGLVLVVNALNITQASPNEIEQQAKVLRDRLDDLLRHAGAKFPVYLVFTHADEIAGFADFFRGLSADERAQAWGVTFPTQLAAEASKRFDSEFDTLYKMLLTRRLLRLREPDRADEQLRVFDFPFHFRNCRRNLALFISQLLRPDTFSKSEPFLRGFYFTANPEGGDAATATPLRRGAMTTELAVPAFLTGALPPNAMPAGAGYFTAQLFSDVLFGDRHLAARLNGISRSKQFLRYGLAGAAATLLLFSTIGLLVSYKRNDRMIERGKDIGGTLRELQKQKDAAGEARELDRLRDFLATPPSIFDRFGLYTGTALGEPLRQIYYEAIFQKFLRPAALELETALNGFAQGANTKDNEYLGRHYDLFRTYLMLGQKSNVETEYLRRHLPEFWRKQAPPELSEQSWRAHLEFFTKQLGQADAPIWPTRNDLREKVETAFSKYGPVQLYFNQVTRAADRNATGVTLQSVGTNSSWLTAAHSVPGSFTINGYYKHLRGSLNSVADEAEADQWVLPKQERIKAAQLSELRDIYAREYTGQWQKFLGGIVVKKFNSPTDVVNAFTELADKVDSPLGKIVRKAARETRPANPTSEGWFDWLGNMFTQERSVELTKVDNEFQELANFVAGDKETGLTRYLDYLNNLRIKLDSTKFKTNPKPTSKDLNLEEINQQVNQLLQSLDKGATKEAAKLLREPITRLGEFLGETDKTKAASDWSTLSRDLNKLEGSLPLAGSADAPLDDFNLLLNPAANGRLAQFVKNNLSALDNSSGQWVKTQNDSPGTEEFINYLNQVEALRRVFFPNNIGEARFNYTLTLARPPAGTQVVINVDGVPLDSQSGLTINGSWPARSGSAGARITVTTAGVATPLDFTGQWGLFKMFSAGGPARGDGQWRLSWEVGGVTVRATLNPIDPFKRELFTLRAPQTVQ